jgi:hypothetical protein
MHAIKAFRMLPETAAPERVEGCERLESRWEIWSNGGSSDTFSILPLLRR